MVLMAIGLACSRFSIRLNRCFSIDNEGSDDGVAIFLEYAILVYYFENYKQSDLQINSQK